MVKQFGSSTRLPSNTCDVIYHVTAEGAAEERAFFAGEGHRVTGVHETAGGFHAFISYDLWNAETGEEWAPGALESLEQERVDVLGEAARVMRDIEGPAVYDTPATRHPVEYDRFADTPHAAEL